MRFCVLLCYLYHGLDDSACRACLFFCLFLLRNPLCNKLLTLIDCNGRKTVFDRERSNGKGQVNDTLEQKLSLRNRIKQATKPGQGEHPKWDLASACRLMLSVSRAGMVIWAKERNPTKSCCGYRGLLGQRSGRWFSHLKGKDSKQEQCGFFSLL